jgi:hypothetical protein
LDSLQSLRQGELDAGYRCRTAADHLLARAMAAIADNIPNPNRTLVVFNSLMGPRRG